MRIILKFKPSNIVRLTIQVILVTLLLNACVTTKKAPITQDNSNKVIHEKMTVAPRADNQYLSREQAFKRSARISNVSYQLHYNLTGEKNFSASSIVNFSLSDNSTPLTIDLNKAKITNIVINNFSMTVKQITENYNGWFITLPIERLIKGNNTVVINFTRDHSTNGEGLHRFEDPIDNKVYLYSHFEPAAAQQMFALFDQPDLKATFELTVSAPKEWTVISATQEDKITKQGNFNIWHFPKSKNLSPYNFSLHAGPYKMWQDNSGKYPLRLFTRQSVANQITPKHWFTYTNQGFKFFDNYFGIDYPFKKYDQVLVPDFLYGAMENTAAVTFAEESFLTNGEMSKSRRQSLASVIMHEMAHQWFGNLATMKWWNGLWLNESFAAFMASLASSEVTEFKSAWRNFYAGEKQSAYRADQRITTHPIEVPVPSTANAFDNIDAITYSKGASVLNQLRHLIGDNTFKQGLHNYLDDNSYKNAVLGDFINSLEKASGRDLTLWQQNWLYQAGVNTIEASYQCNAGKIITFSLLQTADEKLSTLREQKVQIALFKTKKPGFSLITKLNVIYQGQQTQVKELVGIPCPDLVYPNYQDWAYVKVNLDSRSFKTTQRYLAQIQDPLLRSMLWQSLWDSVRDGKLPINEYLQVALENAPLEQDYTTLGQVLKQISSAKIYLNKGLGKQHAYVKSFSQQLEEIAWESTLFNGDDSSIQRRWFKYFIKFSHTDTALNNLYKLLNGQHSLDGLTINQDVRWSIIKQLSRFNHPKAAKLIARELTLDSSDTGEKSAIYAKVIAPNIKVKNNWLAIIQDNTSKIGFSTLRTAMSALYPSEQNHFSEKSATQRLSSLASIDKENSPVFMRSYNKLIPATCNEVSVARLATAVSKLTTLSEGTKRQLLIKQQEDQRCLMIRNNITVLH